MALVTFKQSMYPKFPPLILSLLHTSAIWSSVSVRVNIYIHGILPVTTVASSGEGPCTLLTSHRSGERADVGVTSHNPAGTYPPPTPKQKPQLLASEHEPVSVCVTRIHADFIVLLTCDTNFSKCQLHESLLGQISSSLCFFIYWCLLMAEENIILPINPLPSTLNEHFNYLPQALACFFA